MRIILPGISLTLCLSFLAIAANTQHTFNIFDSFGKSVGLKESVTCMDQDEDGFFWLVTRDGLSRFDGVQAIRIYYPVTDSIPGSWTQINMLSCDTIRHLVWLATQSGVVRFGRRTGQSHYW